MRPCITEHGTPKRRYATRGEAWLRVEPVSRLSSDGRVQAYQCPECGYWHIGHARRGRPQGDAMSAEVFRDGQIFTGIYNKVRTGLTITEDGPVWSVDIETDVDGITVYGCGSTLAEASAEAAQSAAAHAKPFIPIEGVERGAFGEPDNEKSFSNNG